MNNQKSQVGIIIFVIILAILIIVGIFLAIYGSHKGWFSGDKGKEVVVPPTISILAKVLDQNNQATVSKFYIEADGIRLKQGTLEKVWNEFTEMPINKTYRFCFWNDKNYRECIIYDRALSNTIANKVGKNITYKNMSMTGNFYNEDIKATIKISNIDNLSKGTEQRLRLNISVANGSINRLSICTWHSIGIIYVANPDMEIHCNEWTNYTYNQDNQLVNLTAGYYWCKENNQFEYCDKMIKPSTCIHSNIAPPDRLKGNVDSCFYTGLDINNKDYIADYRVKTIDFIDPLDYINFYVIDKELAKKDKCHSIGDDDGSCYDFYDTDIDGSDSGIPDILYRLNYTEKT